MSRLWFLVKGELQRLHKYNVTTISFAVALIWGTLIYFLGGDLIPTLLPMVLLIDATMMSLMYVGAIMYFEKSESTISTLLVTPVTKDELLLAKIISNTLHNMFSSGLIILAFALLSDIKINYLLIAIAILISTAIHTVIGICLSYTTKDFTRLLMRVITFAFVLMLPSMLYFFGILDGPFWEVINLLNPVNGALELISVSFEGAEVTWKYWISLTYLIIGGFLLYILYAKPKFQEYAVRQSGV
jgi:fluoroquinolone transport system permease protein